MGICISKPHSDDITNHKTNPPDQTQSSIIAPNVEQRISDHVTLGHNNTDKIIGIQKNKTNPSSPITKETNVTKETTQNIHDRVHPTSKQMKVILPNYVNDPQFSGLYEIFKSHSFDDNQTKMDIDGLTSALKIFGLIINRNKHIQQQIYNKFDLENIKEIDYNDFMATMSSLIDSTNEDSLFILFQVFDYDNSGYLEVDEVAELLFAQQKIAAAVNNQPSMITDNTKQKILNDANKFINDGDDNGDGKISFDEYNQWRREHHVATPM